MALYQATGGVVYAAPSVALTAPAANASVSATFPATASATDDAGVLSVQFQVDGVPSGAEDTSAPYGVAINTTRYAEGQHA